MPLYHNKWRTFLNEGTKRTLTEEELLAESRKENVKKKYPELDKRGLIDELSLEDPSGNNAYLAWMAKQINNYFEQDETYNARQEFIKHVINATNSFHSNKQRLKQKDLNQYKTVADLNQTIDALGLTSKDKRKQQREREAKILAQQSFDIFENDDMEVIRPLTKEASCVLGKDAKWCIAATKSKNYWYDYLLGRQTGDNIPRAFIIARLNNLDQGTGTYEDKGDPNKVIALEYKYEPYGEPEFVQMWDAPNDASDEDSFSEAVAINILDGVLGTGNGLAAYNRLYRRKANWDDEITGEVGDEDLIAIIEHLENNYQGEFGFEDIEYDKEKEDWRDDAIEQVTDILPRIGYDIIQIGLSNIETAPPEMDTKEHEKILDAANKQHDNIHFSFDDNSYDSYMDIRYAATFNFKFHGVKLDPDVDIDEVAKVALETIHGEANIYPGENDAENIYVDYDDDDLIVSFTYNSMDPYGERSEFGPSPEDFEDFVYQIGTDIDMEHVHKEMLEAFENNDFFGADPTKMRPADIISYLNNKLKNFDEVDLDDGTITAYGDLKVQLPRVPKKFLELSKKIGTDKQPGELHHLKDIITGPFRNENETLANFLQMLAIKNSINSYDAETKFKSAIHRFFATIGMQADKQLSLDLQTKKQRAASEVFDDIFENKSDLNEDDSYMKANFSMGVVRKDLAYDPISGKATINFWIDFPARENAQWNIKFLELADKYWRSIEDAYEIAITESLENFYKKQEAEIEEKLRKYKDESSKKPSDGDQGGPIVKNVKGERMLEHFKGWRNFLK